jgi:zinc transport system substrate-binding protein
VKKILLGIFLLYLFAFLRIFIPLYGSEKSSFSAEKAIGVTIAPYKKLVNELCGPSYQVHILVPSAQDPHAFEPTPKQMQAFSKCDVWFLSHEPLESQVQKKLHLNAYELPFDKTDGSHDFLSCKQLKKKVEQMTLKLCELYPEDASSFKQNAQKVLKRLDQLDQGFASTKAKAVLTQHDCFAVLCRDYQKQHIAIEQHGKEPTFSHLQTISKKAQEHQVKKLFVQPQYSKKEAHLIAKKLDLEIVEVDIYQEDLFNTLNSLLKVMQNE